jgi:hypothetical protein
VGRRRREGGGGGSDGGIGFSPPRSPRGDDTRGVPFCRPLKVNSASLV